MRAPLLRVTIAFAVGVIVGDYLPAINVPCAIVAVLAVVLFGVLAYRHKVSNALIFNAQLLIVFSALGYLSASLLTPTNNSRHYIHHIDNSQTIELCIKEPPRRTFTGWRAIAKVEKVENERDTIATNGLIEVLLHNDSIAGRLTIGSRFRTHASVEPIAAPTNPHQFDRSKYMRHKKVWYQTYLRDENIEQLCPRYTIRATIERTRIPMLKMLDILPTQQSRALAKAMLLGWREEIDAPTQSLFRDAGIAHVLCVSGLHVGLAAALLSFITTLLLPRRLRTKLSGWVQIVSVWLFVMLTGLAPSAIRAGVMFSMLALSRMMSLKNHTLNNVAAAALIMLLINPMLIFDVGFQLSFAAVGGIVTAMPSIRDLPLLHIKLLSRGSWGLYALNSIWNWACLSTIAQLSTLPLTLYYFHTFPTYFLISNLTVVPLMGLVLLLTSIVMAFHWCTPIATLAAKVVDMAFTIIARLLSTVTALPYSTLNNIYFDKIMALAVGAAVICLLVFAVERKPWMAVCSLALVLSSGGYNLYKMYHTEPQQAITVYSTGKRTAIECRCGRQTVYLCDTATLANPARIDYQTYNNRLYHFVNEVQYVALGDTFANEHYNFDGHLISCNWCSAIICNGTKATKPKLERLHYPTELNADYLILTNNYTGNIINLCEQHRIKMVIIAGNNSRARREQWHRQCEKAGLRYHDIASDGALIITP